MKFPTIGQVHFDSIGVEVRKWGTSGVKFQNEKYTLLLAEGLQSLGSSIVSPSVL